MVVVRVRERAVVAAVTVQVRVEEVAARERPVRETAISRDPLVEVADHVERAVRAGAGGVLAGG